MKNPAWTIVRYWVEAISISFYKIWNAYKVACNSFKIMFATKRNNYQKQFICNRVSGQLSITIWITVISRFKSKLVFTVL